VDGQELNHSDLKFDGHLDPTTQCSQIAKETMRTSQAARLNVKSVAGSTNRQQTDRRVPQPSAHEAWTAPAHISEGLRAKKEHALDWRRSRPTQRRRSAIARSLPPKTNQECEHYRQHVVNCREPSRRETPLVPNLRQVRQCSRYYKCQRDSMESGITFRMGNSRRQNASDEYVTGHVESSRRLVG
jgi:hypothetical protein